ncbi:hypothetical protein M301_1274 [Methylotenera versatilis 301]|uniref:Laminin G domain-containing protein n=1 Tax=Methylotenera versatilis (strain 301) TaxID=666681 RepID=D7DHX2_METV0|nr:hypothetical protein M301_1274 [Methylotenera versatilis 301]
MKALWHIRLNRQPVLYWCTVLLIVSTLFVVSIAHAATYAYLNDNFSYDTPTATATSVTWHTTSPNPACTDFPAGDDDWADVTFPTGFTFTFGSVNYSSVRIYSNGMLAFGTDTSGYHRTYTNVALPISTAAAAYTGCTTSGTPKNLMVAYWTDIVAGTADNTTGAAVKYELLTDSDGKKRFVISWSNVKLYNQTARYNFQIALFESNTGVNGNFKYNYTTGSSDGSAATVGVQLTTTDSTQYAFKQNFIDTTNGTTILWYPANQLAAKTAEYRLDESIWLGVAGEIKDTSGNSQDASRVGTPTSTASGKLCRGGSFTSNVLNTVIDAIATPITPAGTGSVDFWYKSNVAWNAASSDAMLFDATKVAAQPFFLEKLTSGKLRFVLTDSAGAVRIAEATTASTFAAGTWHHVGVSWNIKVGTNQTVQQIFLDGALVTTNTTTPFRTTSSGSIAALSTIYIGDNRSSGITPANGSPNSANGFIDEIYIYAKEINATQAAADMAITRTTCTSLDHFHIMHAGQVVGCNAANIVIEAHDATHALFSLAGTTMQMSTSTNHGTWSSVSSINPVNDTGGGTGNYTFSNESSITLGLTNGFIEALNINLLSGSITEKTGTGAVCLPVDYTSGTTCDSNLNFLEAGFLLDVPNHVSETSQTLSIKAVKKADNSLVCTPAFASVSKSISFTCAYTNPTTGTLPIRINSNALNSSNSTGAACDSTGRAVSVAFDATGSATATLQYADVGNMTLNAKYLVGGLNMAGTDTFIAAPASFAITGVTAAPIKAGNNFSATVTAKNAAGAATPNFAKENVAEGVNLTFTKCQPTGSAAVNGNFTGALGAFTNGVASSNTLKWSEVGNIDLSATLTSANYLGSGLTATGNTGTGGTMCNSAGNVGRFTPDHFNTVVTQGCNTGSYTYSAQPFTVQTIALNAAGAVTINYDGSSNTSPNFAKATALSDASGATVGTLNNAAISLSAYSAGIATSVTPSYTFTSKLTVPTAIKLRATDIDNINSSLATEGTANIRSGLLRLPNVYGSELLALPVPVEAKYWNGTSYIRNQQDSCTILPAASISMSNYRNNLTACETQLGYSSGSGALVNGVSKQLRLTRPGSGNNGTVDLTLNLGSVSAAPNNKTCTGAAETNAVASGLSWFGTNTTSRATFGIYKTPVIYLRENF